MESKPSSQQEEILEKLLKFWKHSFDTPLTQDEKLGFAGKYKFRKQKFHDARQTLQLDIYDAKAAKKCLAEYSFEPTIDGLFRLYLKAMANEWNFAELLRRNGVSSQSSLHLYEMFQKIMTIDQLLDILEQAVGERREYQKLFRNAHRATTAGTAETSQRSTAKTVNTYDRENSMIQGDESFARETERESSQYPVPIVATTLGGDQFFDKHTSSTLQYDLKSEQVFSVTRKNQKEFNQNIPQLIQAGIPAVNAQRLHFEDLYEGKLIDDASMDTKYSLYAHDTEENELDVDEEDRPVSRSNPRVTQLGLSRSHELARSNAAKFGKNFYTLLALSQQSNTMVQDMLKSSAAPRINEFTKAVVAGKRILRNQEQPTESASREKYLHICEMNFIVPYPAVLYGLGSESLVLQGWSLSDSDVYAISEAIALNGTVELLDLSDNRITDEGAQYLASAVERNAKIGGKLNILNLSKNYIGTKGAGTVSTAISKHPNVEEFEIARNNIEDSYHSSLKTLLSLKACNRLQALNLSGQKLRDSTLSTIGDWLSSKGASTLSSLNLGWNMFSKKAIASFFYILAGNSSLKQLRMEYNNFGEEGGISVAFCLLYNKVLQELHISNCRINPIAGILIADSLRFNEKLQVLDLRRNPLGSYAASFALSSVANNGYRLTNLGITGTEFSDTARQHIVVKNNQNEKYPFKTKLPRPQDIEIVDTDPPPSWGKSGVSYDINIPDGHYTLNLKEQRDHIVANLLLLRVKTNVGIWIRPKLRNRFLLKNGEQELNSSNIPASLEKTIMPRNVSKKILQLKYVTGTHNTSESKDLEYSAQEEEEEDEEGESEQSEVESVGTILSSHLQEVEEKYSDALPKSTLTLLLTGQNEDHLTLARVLKAMQDIGLGKLQRLRFNSESVQGKLLASDTVQEGAWDEVIASLYYPTINVAIEYESAVFSISGTLRFSMSKDNERHSLMDILETGENSISQGSEGPPWRKLKYNGESVPLHRWRSASAKKKSKWNVPTQGIAQLDFMAENFYILEPKVHVLDLRDPLHSDLLSKMRDENRLDLGYFLVELEGESDELSTSGIFTLLHKLHEQCKVDLPLPTLEEYVDHSSYKRVLEFAATPIHHHCKYHCQDIQLNMSSSHDRDLFEALRLRSKSSTCGHSIGSGVMTVRRALKKIEEERRDFSEKQWLSSCTALSTVGKYRNSAVSTIASKTEISRMAGRILPLHWDYTDSKSIRERTKSWGSFHTSILADAFGNFEGIILVELEHVAIPMKTPHLSSWVTPLTGYINLKYYWWCPAETTSSSAFARLCKETENQVTDVDRMGLLKTICEDEHIIADGESSISDNMLRFLPDVGISEKDVIVPPQEQIINSMKRSPSDPSFHFTCAMIQEIVDRFSFSQGKTAAASFLRKYTVDAHLFASIVWKVNEAKSKENALTEFNFQRQQSQKPKEAKSPA